MPVPNQFANVTTTIPLSQLDANFNTAITLGNTAIQLGNTVTTLNNMTFANVTITSVSTPITAAQGGTGLSTLASNNVLLGNGTGTVQVVAPGSAGNVLTSTGTTWTSNAASSLAVTSFSAGTTGFTPNSATQGAVTLAGTLATTNGGTGLTSFTNNGVLYASSTSALTTGSAFTFDGSGAVISVNSATDALRITQTGAGNAFLVEDSANPDATPFVVDASGRLVVGHTTALTATGGIPNIQYVGGAPSFGVFGFNSTAATGAVTFARSKSATIGTNAALVAGDQMAAFRFQGADGGTAYLDGAQILAVADGSFSATSSPGRLVFSTTADGASSPTERMRISNSGNVGIGGSGSDLSRLLISGTLTTSSTNSQALRFTPTVPSTTTNGYWSVLSAPLTQATSFTLSNLYHFSADPQTFGAGSAVTNQYGFIANSSLTGATNNFGFYSNIASGTGRWNFYANGTADNAFAGNTRFGALTAPTVAVDVTGAILATTTIRSSGATSGIGYATGAGSTATQGAGSGKATAVTLNNVCGQITLNNAALNANTTVSFTLTNSAIAATDVLVLNHVSAGTAGAYTLNAQPAAGSATINVRNVTAGNLSEAIVIGYAVIKAVTA